MKNQNSATNSADAAIVLCAGKGTRMNDNCRNKVAFECAGIPVIRRIAQNLRDAGVTRIVAVVGFMAESVMDALDGIPGVFYVFQKEQKGTGHAALCGIRLLQEIGQTGSVIITMGDKIVATEVFAALRKRSAEAKAVWGVQPVTANKGGGRIVTDNEGKPYGVVELADAALMSLADTPVEKWNSKLAAIGLNAKKAAKVIESAARKKPCSTKTLAGRSFTADEILNAKFANAGLYCFDINALSQSLGGIGSDNAQGEIYLTDALEYFAAKSEAELLEIPRAEDMLTYSTRPELRAISWKMMHSASSFSNNISSGKIHGELVNIYGDATNDAETRILNLLKKISGDRRVVMTRAPGRVNLMGRHIDHRGGSVNVMAIDRDTIILAAPRDDDTITVTNIDNSYPDGAFSIAEELSLAPECSAETPLTDREKWLEYISSPKVITKVSQSKGSWINYIKSAVLRIQMATDIPLSGMDLYVDGTIPPAAGLSSSSSLVVATAEAVAAVNCLLFTKRRFVDICGEGEWYVGSRGGCGDHAAMKCSATGRITHLSFKPFEIGSSAPFDSKYAVLVADSLQKAKKSEGGKDKFNAKVAAYEFAFMMLQKYFPAYNFKEFRDIAAIKNPAEIYKLLTSIPEFATRNEVMTLLPEHCERLAVIFATHADPGKYDLRGVALYGISECIRADRFTQALQMHDYKLIGDMMKRSHDGDRVTGERITDELLESLSRTNADPALQSGAYGCSTREIDELCDWLNAQNGVLGSELVGAGLGGSLIALIEKDKANCILSSLTEHYYTPLGETPKAFICLPSAGSAVIF